MQTSIPMHGNIECQKCGHKNSIDMGDNSVLRCTCGATYSIRHKRPDCDDLLRIFGYELTVDYDGALLVDSDSEPTEELRDWLFQRQADFRSSIEWNGKMARAVYIGGSLAGQHHRQCFTNLSGDTHVRIGRAHWETYEFRNKGDSRMYYVGQSTSKAKAKRGEFVACRKARDAAKGEEAGK